MISRRLVNHNPSVRECYPFASCSSGQNERYGRCYSSDTITNVQTSGVIVFIVPYC